MSILFGIFYNHLPVFLHNLRLFHLKRQFGVFTLSSRYIIGYQIEPFFAKIVKIKWFPVKINYFSLTESPSMQGACYPEYPDKHNESL